jgi:predicted dehydrogenase
MRGGFGGAYYGTAGTIDGLLLNGEPFDFPDRNPSEQSPRGPGNQALLPHVTGVHREIEEQHVYEDVMQLVDWVRDGTPSIVTAEHARHVIDIIESAYRASATGQTQNLTTTF